MTVCVVEAKCAPVQVMLPGFRGVTDVTPKWIVPLLREGVIRDPVRCPECKGTGKYVGFLLVEPCQRCQGSGRA